jgi:hypothetical protein
MYESTQNRFVRLSEGAQAALVAAARDVAPVRGLTHSFYKYPARFSPVFASAAIEAFTEPGDLVLDPHVGGGTTLVEAIAAGREAVGVDISTLSEFVTGIKCTIFSEAELETLERWAGRVAASVDIHKPSIALSDYEQLGYYKHLDHSSRWRLRKAIEQSPLLGWKPLVGVSFCDPRNGRSTVEANARPPRISAASFGTRRSTWCAGLVTCVHLQELPVGIPLLYCVVTLPVSKMMQAYADCAPHDWS